MYQRGRTETTYQTFQHNIKPRLFSYRMELRVAKTNTQRR